MQARVRRVLSDEVADEGWFRWLFDEGKVVDTVGEGEPDGKVGRCFENVLVDPVRPIHVGYAAVGADDPVPHAWNIDGNDEIWERTPGFGGAVYFGVHVPREEYCHVCRSGGAYHEVVMNDLLSALAVNEERQLVELPGARKWFWLDVRPTFPESLGQVAEQIARLNAGVQAKGVVRVRSVARAVAGILWYNVLHEVENQDLDAALELVPFEYKPYLTAPLVLEVRNRLSVTGKFRFVVGKWTMKRVRVRSRKDRSTSLVPLSQVDPQYWAFAEGLLLLEKELGSLADVLGTTNLLEYEARQRADWRKEARWATRHLRTRERVRAKVPAGPASDQLVPAPAQSAALPCVLVQALGLSVFRTRPATVSFENVRNSPLARRLVAWSRETELVRIHVPSDHVLLSAPETPVFSNPEDLLAIIQEHLDLDQLTDQGTEMGMLRGDGARVLAQYDVGRCLVDDTVDQLLTLAESNDRFRDQLVRNLTERPLRVDALLPRATAKTLRQLHQLLPHRTLPEPVDDELLTLAEDQLEASLMQHRHRCVAVDQQLQLSKRITVDNVLVFANLCTARRDLPLLEGLVSEFLNSLAEE